MTNADRIRAMTDEQLAAMIVGHTFGTVWRDCVYYGPDGTVYGDNKEAVDAWTEWLSMERMEVNDAI